MRYPITIVVGGQYGSEAKGLIAAYLTNNRNIDIAVRTGATNAGHTVYHQLPGRERREFKMQQLPVGWVNPNTQLVLGAGALIDPSILKAEVEMLEAYGVEVKSRLWIDHRAGLHVPVHTARSKASGRHHRMGATGKGCSEALIDRILNRGSEAPMLFGDSPYVEGFTVTDTERMLNGAWDGGAKILLEGTQGQLLDLYLGPYPYVTHKQTGPAQWLLECGLSPSLPTDIVMVIRTYPIRVAGNSGPMPQETSWPILARDINLVREKKGLHPIVRPQSIIAFEDAVRATADAFHVPHGSDGLDQHVWDPGDRVRYREALSELHRMALETIHPEVVRDLRNLFEMTTVTKKLRRVAYLDHEALKASARQVRPHSVAVTFMNYLFPDSWYHVPSFLNEDTRHVVNTIEESCLAPVSILSWGPGEEHCATIRHAKADWRSGV